MSHSLKIKPGSAVRLKDFDPRDAGGMEKADAAVEIAANTEAVRDLAYRLYAENRRALLLVLQGMDTSGKDGTIRSVMQGVSPQSCQVVPFKQPSDEELDHDFLWRIHLRTPRKGNIGIFNRSHYEDVLVVRVHNLVPPEVWKTRYETINRFEELLSQNTTIIKCYLHISKNEQKERLQERLNNPKKNWKFAKSDLAERKFWDQYQEAAEDMFAKCSTHHAPWYVIPADRKWYRDLCVSRILRQTLEMMDPQYPPPEEGIAGLVVE